MDTALIILRGFYNNMSLIAAIALGACLSVAYMLDLPVLKNNRIEIFALIILILINFSLMRWCAP